MQTVIIVYHIST